MDPSTPNRGSRGMGVSMLVGIAGGGREFVDLLKHAQPKR